MIMILRHIARDKLSAARTMRIRFNESFARLAENPRIGSQRPDLTTKPVRFWPVESYHVVYQPESKPLIILRILSGYRDIAVILG